MFRNPASFQISGGSFNRTIYNANEANPSEERSWATIAVEFEKEQTQYTLFWQQQLDTLVLVGSLVSVMMSIFSIEAYRWLRNTTSPRNDMAYVALTRISQQLSDPSTPSILSEPPVPPTAGATLIIINCLWFTSLIFAVTTTVVGILSKQWLYEHEHHVTTRTDTERIALDKIKDESLDQWGVKQVLELLLPLFIQISLLLFLVGLLMAFWIQNTVLFAIGLATIGTVLVFYTFAHVMPTVQMISMVLDVRHGEGPLSFLASLPSLQTICPYKAPQAWIVFGWARRLLQTSFAKHIIHRLLRRSDSFGSFQDMVDLNLKEFTGWSSLDLCVLRHFETLVEDVEGVEDVPKMYELAAINSVLQLFRNSPSKLLHLRNIFNTFSPSSRSILFPALFNQWNLPIWKPCILSDDDVEEVLTRPVDFFSRERAMVGLSPYTGDDGPTKDSPYFTKLLFYYASWDHFTVKQWRTHYDMTEWFYNNGVPAATKVPFIVPFHQLATLLEDGPCSSEEQACRTAIGVEFLKFYQLGWEIAGKMNTGRFDQLALVEALSEHILHARTTLFRSKVAVDFIQSIHAQIKEECLYENGAWVFADIRAKWEEALQLVEKKFIGHERDLPFLFFLHRLNMMFVVGSRECDGAVQDLKEYVAREWEWGHINRLLYDICHFFYAKVSPIALSGGPSALEDIDWLESAPESLDWTPIIHLNKLDSPLAFLTSEAGLAFLRYVNNKLDTSREEVFQFLPYAWVHVLKCVCVLNHLPLTYFPRIYIPPPKPTREQFNPKELVWVGGSSHPESQPGAVEESPVKDDQPAPYDNKENISTPPSGYVFVDMNIAPPEIVVGSSGDEVTTGTGADVV